MAMWVFHGWATEALREATISFIVGVITGTLVTIILAWLGHHHIIKRMERHHTENMEAHSQTHGNLK